MKKYQKQIDALEIQRGYVIQKAENELSKKNMKSSTIGKKRRALVLKITSFLTSITNSFNAWITRNNESLTKDINELHDFLHDKISR